jgi:hypothetical protein
MSTRSQLEDRGRRGGEGKGRPLSPTSEPPKIQTAWRVGTGGWGRIWSPQPPYALALRTTEREIAF